MPNPTIGMVNWGDDLNARLDEIEASSGGVPELAAEIDQIQTQRFDVEDYGANPAGTGNNTTAVQDAIDAAIDAGGGTVWLPHPVDYLCTTTSTADGLTWVLSIAGSNVTITGVPGLGLKTTANASLLHLNGGGMATGIANWRDYWLHDSTSTPVQAISSVAKGDAYLTFTTPANAGNYEAGDMIYYRTGHVASSWTATELPDAEINEVLIDGDTGTGRVYLRWPTSKALVAENYPTGHPSAGSPTIFGAANVTDRVMRNITLRGIRLISTGTTQMMPEGQILGLTIEDCYIETGSHFQSLNNVRLGRYHDNTVNLTSANTSTAGWWFTTATGSTDVVIRDNDCTARELGQIHIHEGSANIRVVGGTYRSNGTTVDHHLFSVRSRAYDIQILDLSADNAAGMLFYVDGTCIGGGVIDGVTGYRDAGKVGTIGAPYWKIGNRNRFNQHVNFYNDETGGIIAGPVYSAVNVVSGWVADNNQTQVLGLIPTGSFIRYTVQVTEAFNSDGTDQLSIGISGTPAYVVGAIDVSTTGLKASGTHWGWTAVDLALQATYANGGSEPTTGKVLVMIEYLPCAIRVA